MTRNKFLKSRNPLLRFNHDFCKSKKSFTNLITFRVYLIDFNKQIGENDNEMELNQGEENIGGIMYEER